jgi:hypothetical protein
MPRQPPIQKCVHSGEWVYSSLYERYGYWCEEIEPADICHEDWRKKCRECTLFKGFDRKDGLSL